MDILYISKITLYGKTFLFAASGGIWSLYIFPYYAMILSSKLVEVGSCFPSKNALYWLYYFVVWHVLRVYEIMTIHLFILFIYSFYYFIYVFILGFLLFGD